MKLRQLKSQVNEGPFDALKKMGSAVADKFTDASGTGEKNQYIKDQQQKFLRWSNQTQNSKDPNDFDNIIKYVVTQLGFKDVAKLYAIAGVEQQQPAQDQAQQDQQQGQEPQGPDFSIFRDAAKFKSEWDNFVKQNPNYKLIADPELLTVLKDIWMRTGGTKLESFLKSGNIVSSKQLYSINKVLEAQGFSLSNLGYAAKKVTTGFVFESTGPVRGLLTEQREYKLWESAAIKLKEAELTADQINQLFAAVEKGATDAGGNRTMLGKSKDAAAAVNQAWEDLKTKVQNSGPIQNVDAMYDKAAEQLKQATGGDQGVMKYVQAYRDFAKKHPVAQSLIYSALIAAAGISGAGIGGAAALGLFKMVDKLLQGEKFSSAAYSGAKTGAMAYGAGQIGQAMKGGQATGAAPASNTAAQAAQGGLQAVRQQAGNEALKAVQQAVSNGTTAEGDLVHIAATALEKYSQAQGGQLAAQTIDTMAQKVAYQAAKAAMGESVKLSESKISAVFIRAAELQQLNEGIFDNVKSAAGNAVNWAKTKGHNLTTKVTADKLASAWKQAGSPTDSDEVAKILTANGVSDDTVKSVYSSLQIPAAAAAQQDGSAQQQGAQGQAQQDGAAPQQAAQGGSLFSDYKKLRSAWEALLDAGQAPTPQVRGVLKDILQTALKTVESVQINELGNRPNDSSDPRTAGGVANAVGNLKDRRRAAGQANTPQPAQAQQGNGQQGQAAQPAQGQAQQGNGALQATGKILTPEQTAQVWAEVIRSLYDSGQIVSDPGNNPINRAANVFNTLAGNGPVQSKAGMKWNDSSTMTQDIINSLDSLTPDDARRLAGILSKRAQQ